MERVTSEGPVHINGDFVLGDSVVVYGSRGEEVSDADQPQVIQGEIVRDDQPTPEQSPAWQPPSARLAIEATLKEN